MALVMVSNIRLFQVEQFNIEEEAFDWEVTTYPVRKKVLDVLTPYLKLYETTVEFQTKYK